MEKIKNVYQKEPFIQLGTFFSFVIQSKSWPGYQCGVSEYEFLNFHSEIQKSVLKNKWFSIEMIHFSLKNWSLSLTEKNILKWLSRYNFVKKNKNVLIICAGNLPLVGFHDILCCLLLGFNVQIKLSRKDDVLIPSIIKILYFFDESIQKQIHVITDKPYGYDYVIATGSDNSNRYFEYYFGQKPHIFRKNRTSIAVINEEVEDKELLKLSHDILQYFGLGCRSVTKLYLPKGFSIEKLFKNLYIYKNLINHNKYMNNYAYNRSINLLEENQFYDNGFLILKEDENLFSPVSVVNYEYYSEIKDLETKIDSLSNNIQCRVGLGGIPYGTAQKPDLWDYADGVDTIDFLIKN